MNITYSTENEIQGGSHAAPVKNNFFHGGTKVKHYVDFEVWGYISVPVEADNFDEAKDIACEEVSNMDFGCLENVEWEAKRAENAGGETKRYK